MFISNSNFQTCPSQNTSVNTPNNLCLYFPIFDRIFCGCTTNQSKQNSVKVIFSIIHCKNSVWTHIFNYTDALHFTTLFCLHLRKSFSIEDRRTLSSKTMHCVCCFRWCWCVLSWKVVWSELVSLVSCILPPLHWFRAATYHWQLWI